MFLCLCVCSAATQSDPPITDPQIYAQLYINGSVIGEETFISGIQLARDNTTSVSKLDGTALLHLNDTTGCQPNKTLEFPDRSTQNILMVSAGGCTIDQKADTAIALGAAALIVYSTNEQEAIDNSGPSQVRPLFIMFVPADIGEQLRIAGLYVARDRMNRRLRLQISQYDKQVDVWEMTLLAMILLLGLAFILSLALHFRMYWLRRRRMASLNAQRPPGMPTGRAQRHTLSADDLQSQFPVISFTKRLNSTADQKPTETTGDNDSDIETLDVASDDQFVGNELCSICIEDFQEGDPVRRLTCQHVFHKDCIGKFCI
jgi:hypothetical protein